MTVFHPTLKSKFYALLFFVFVPLLSIGQTGPAGVGSSTNNSYWLDAKALDFTDGTLVSTWHDISGNTDNFTQFLSSRQPTYVSSGISGLPSLDFDGVNDVLIAGINTDMESSEITYFIVYDRIGTASSMLINANYESDPYKWRSYSNNMQDRMYSVHFSPGINWVYYNDIGPASFFSSHYEPTQFTTYNQGALGMTKPDVYTVPTGHKEIYLGSYKSGYVSGYRFRGQMSEIIIYNTDINDLERIFIENYLGAKYSMSIASDLYSHDATHKFGLIGLGDDGTDTQTIAQGAGMLELSSPASMSTGEYFLVAHTDFRPSVYNEIDLPASLSTHQRLERTWRVGETGEVGTTTLKFELGEGDFAEASSYRLLVDGDGVFTDAIAHTGTYDAVTTSVSFTVNLADGDYFTLAGIQETLSIHSLNDGLWSEPSTWDCTCIPSAADFVYIEAGTTVKVDIDAYVNFLRIESGGTLAMELDRVLDINGDWEISGSTMFLNGTISLTGEEEQNVSIITSPGEPIIVELNNLLINNTSEDEVTFRNETFRLKGLLSPNRGNLLIDPSTTFIIESVSTTTGGRIGPLISPTTVLGDFTVERFIPSGNADYRNICSPIIGATFVDWDPDLAMSGPGFPDGCAYGPDGCFISVRFTQGGISGNVSNVGFPILNARSYEVYMGTGGLDVFAGTTLKSTGPINNTSDVTKILTTGWATIGNPFVCPITYNSIDKTSQISKYYYVYDAVTGGYQWYDQASGTSSSPEITADGLLSIGQGIWVKASSYGTINFRQSDKVTNTDATYIRTADEALTALTIRLNENNSTYESSMTLEEYVGASDGFDDTLDISHLSTGREKAPSIAFDFDNELVRKNYVNKDGREKSFLLHTKFLNDGYYTLSIVNLGSFGSYQKILLFDNETGEIVDLKKTEYVFYALAETEEEETLREMKKSRFTLVLSNSTEATNTGFESIENSGNGIVVKQIGNMIDVQSIKNFEETTTITLTNIIGQKEVFKTTTKLISGSNLVTLPNTLTGFHLIIIKTGDEIITHKIVL